MAYAFSDTTNKKGLIQLCELYTGLGDTGISGNSTYLKQFTNLINVAYQKVVSMILAAQDDWDWDDIGTSDGSTGTQTNYPIGTINMVAGQRDYSLPASLKILKLKRIDVTYDNTTYYKAEEWDSATTPDGLGNDTITDARFSRTSPRYDLRANSIFIYPAATSADVAAGANIRLEFFREPSEFASTDTTKTPGIDTPFHPFIAVLASFEWCMSQDLARVPNLMAIAQDWESRLKQYYGRKNEDQVIPLKAYNITTYS